MVPVLLMSIFAGLAGRPAPQGISQDRLAEVLGKTAAYCRAFANATLHYVCLEDVTEKTYLSFRKMPRRKGGYLESPKISHLVYDYQLVKRGAEITERRTLLEEDGEKRNIPDAPLGVKRFKYRQIIMGPMLLNEYWQKFHDYRVVGKEKISREPCLIIEAVPKTLVGTGEGPTLEDTIGLPFKPGQLFGRIWVSERDWRVWKLEWDPRSIGNYEAVEEMAEALNAEPRLKLEMVYAFDHKGIRFPSRYVLSEDYVSAAGARFIRSDLTVVFKNYKFFTVETEVDFRNR